MERKWEKKRYMSADSACRQASAGGVEKSEDRGIWGSGALPHRIIPRARAQAKLTVEMLKFEIQIEQQKAAAFVSLSFFFAHKKSK